MKGFFFSLFVCRDSLIYAMSANRNGLEEVVDILSEVILRPKITDDEVIYVFIFTHV